MIKVKFQFNEKVMPYSLHYIRIIKGELKKNQTSYFHPNAK